MHHSAAIVCGGDGAEALLPGGVPSGVGQQLQPTLSQRYVWSVGEQGESEAACYQICSLILLPSSSIVRILKSMP